MICDPFVLLNPYRDRLSVTLFAKTDAINSDQSVAEILSLSDYGSVHQVHGSHTVVLRSPSHSTHHADGILTDTSNLLLMIRGADCQLFLVYIPRQHIVGLLHVGWRGLLSKALSSFYSTLQNEWGVHPHETIVCEAPSLCMHCAAFSDPRKELPTIDQTFFHGNLVDLQGAAEHELHTLGVPHDHIERHPDCTSCTRETYWTYRGGDRQSVDDGYRNVLTCILH